MARRSCEVLENTRMQPVTCLLIDGGPRRKVMWQKSPLTASLDDIAYCVEQIAQRVARCGASSRMRVRYGSRNSHSPSVTSLGYDFRVVFMP